MPQGLIDNYQTLRDRYDEMLDEAGEVRPAWQIFADRLTHLPEEALNRRAEYVRDAIEADGVTYNVYDDSRGFRRPWELDMLPLIVGSDAWQPLATAVAQRARLLNAILADLYGPQYLLAEGLLPTSLIFGQQGFQWPALGIQPPGGIWLHHYAADLARSPDGRWWVIGDRTQGPSGAGYALQNRIIVSRAFPDTFRDQHTLTLAGFFRTMQDSLTRFANTQDEISLPVLLTPGPFNETYFEHTFLARYLGFPLVEGQDLTVRQERVYLKTLRGLRPVHAILRRLDDDFCDPLELYSESALGVPGLMSAIRAGNVVMANQIGSSILESTALQGFLPAICQRLLGEPLALPSVATWWCGEEPALQYVLENLDDLVIKSAYPARRMRSVFGHELRGEARKRMIASICNEPHAYVAQEWVRLSQAPVWQRRLMPRSLGLRVFAVASPEGYSLMPGALGRVAPRAGMEVISMQRGGLSKDTWVRAEKPVVRTSMLKRRLGVTDLVCGAADIPSRVGENLFWMGRYAERLEVSARLLRAAVSRASSSESELENGLDGLVAAMNECGMLARASSPAEGKRSFEEDLLGALTDVNRSGSVATQLRALSLAANQVRERLSGDNWQALNRLSQLSSRPVATLDQALRALDQIMLSAISLAGFATDDMTRDEGWRFLIMGRRIERLAGLSAIFSVGLGHGADSRDRMFDWLLEVANAIVTYRARYRRAPELLPLVHLVVFDDTNPHAVTFQIDAIQRYLAKTARELGHAYPDTHIDPLAHSIHAFDLASLEDEECEPALAELLAILGRCEQSAHRISDEIHRRFFTHTVRSKHLHSTGI